MEKIIVLVIALLPIGLLVKVILTPMHLIWKLMVNSLCGFFCLWLLNLISGFTGVYFPINPVTAAISGFLGIPGIALLALVQVFL